MTDSAPSSDSRSGEAENLAESFLEQSPALSWIVDRDHRFIAIYGDPSPLFDCGAAHLRGLRASEAPVDSVKSAAWTARFERALCGESLTLRERLGEAAWNIVIFPLRVAGEIRYAAGIARENTAFAKAEKELRYTVLGALKAQEFERSTLSKFLHDIVGQNLTALGLQLDLVRMDLESTAPQQCSRIVEIQQVLEEMMEQVREYSYELNPSTVERAGLRPALDRLAVRLRERFHGALRLNVDPSLKIEKKIASALFHIAQEAVENSLQHSSCSAIEIAVKSSRIGILLEVKDNGKGFDPADLEGGCRGLGLLSMEHHAAQAGLELLIISHRGLGTVVRAGEPGAV
jgi:two-component system NarL family sensor kinase